MMYYAQTIKHRVQTLLVVYDYTKWIICLKKY